MFGDKGYVNNSLKRAARKAGVFWGGLKRQFRYMGIAKNAAQVSSLIGLINLYLAR